MRRWAWRAAVGWEVVRSLLPMAFIEFGLRTGDLRRTCRRLQLTVDLESGEPPATRTVQVDRRMRRIVRGATWLVARWPGGDTCLRRTLLIGYRLRESGPVVRIGVRRGPDGSFGAHSWLEVAGTTFDPAAVAFAALGTRTQ